MILKSQSASPLNRRKAALTMCFLLFLTMFLSSFPSTSIFRGQIDNSKKKVDQHVLQLDGAPFTVVIKLSEEKLKGDSDYNFVVYGWRAEMGESQSLVSSFLAEKGATIINSFWLGNYILANVTEDVLYELSRLDFVERVFPNFEVTVLDAFESEGGVQIVGSNVTWGLDRIGAPKAWAMGFNGSGIRVCVIDTGVDVNHPDIVGRLWTDNASDPTYPGGWIEFDEYGNIIKGSTPHDTHGHGTHTSGTVVGGNASGVTIGVAPAAKLMHALALPDGRGTFAQTVAAMQWAIAPFDQYGNPAGFKADVVSMSWGSAGYLDEMIEPIRKMVDYGVIPVASIGNSGEGTSASPGNVYEAFGVGAVDKYDQAPSWSSGQVVDWPASHPEPYVKPDFAAPGVSVYSSVPGGWQYYSGTSMAAPHVAGTAALMLQANPRLSLNDVYLLLRISAKDVGEVGKDVRYGWGIINASAAVELAYSSCGVRGYVLDAETLKPTKWGANVKVFGVEWGEGSTRADGYYSVFLLPGNYTIGVSAFGYVGQNRTFEVSKDVWVELNFTLTPLPTGWIKGKILDSVDGYAIANASVSLLNTPIKAALTDGEGNFSVEAPVGEYILEAWSWGYKPLKIYNVTVLEGHVEYLTLELLRTLKVAVIGDYQGEITNLLMKEISAKELGWNEIQSLRDYNVVIVSFPTDPGKERFLELINLTDQYRVGVVFTSSWDVDDECGIFLLKKYIRDPKGAYYGSGAGVVYYEVIMDHPIFEGLGVGERIPIIVGGYGVFSWFYNYSGVTIATVGTNRTGPVGGGVAYSVRSNGNVHVLLGGLSPWSGTNVKNSWTEEAKKIFVNAVRWASESKSFVPSFSLDPAVAIAGSYVRIRGWGFAPKQKVSVMLNGTLALETFSDFNGSLDAFLKLPMKGDCFYVVEAVDAHGNIAKASIRVVGAANSVSLKAGWNLVSLSLNAPIKVEELSVYYGGKWYNWTEAYESKIVLGYVYWWNGSYLIVNEVEPGKGYWMYAYKPCEVYWYVPEGKG